MRAIKTITVACVLGLVCAGNAAAGRLPDAPEDADYYANGQQPQALVELGRMLFFDKILSGNFNISCATCHHWFYSNKGT